MGGAFILVTVMILSSLFLGGATSYGYLSDSLLQLIAIPVLLVGIWHMLDEPPHTQAKWALTFCLALVLVPLLQLIPLPPDIWTALPGRKAVASALQLPFPDLPWMPLSLSPRSTWLGLLALLPPLAIFIAVHQLGFQARRLLSLTIVAFGIISVFTGLLQVVQGPSSSLRFYEITNQTEAVGFFANRNHYAALLYSSLLLAIAWILAQLSVPDRRASSPGVDTTRILYALVGLTVIVAFIAGILMARSRAGIGLTIAAFIGIYLMSQTVRKQDAGNRSIKLIWAAVALALVFSAQFALFRIMDRLGTSIAGDLRVTFAQVTTKASWDNMPFGTGIGSFVPAFKQYETTADLPGNIYANHAHNDFLEVWLETGVMGLVILALFATGYIYRTYRIWRHPLPRGMDIDHLLAKAATIIVLLVLLHSLADYPLRTTAMMSFMAFACALLIDPPENARKDTFAKFKYPSEGGDKGRPGNKRAPLPQVRSQQPSALPEWPEQATTSTAPQVPIKPQASWNDAEWPEEWRKSGKEPPKGTDKKP